MWWLKYVATSDITMVVLVFLQINISIVIAFYAYDCGTFEQYIKVALMSNENNKTMWQNNLITNMPVTF